MSILHITVTEKLVWRRNLGRIVLALALFAYVTAGVYDEVRLILTPDLPSRLLQHFDTYVGAYNNAIAGRDPYGIRGIGNTDAFLYPPPALLVIWPFSVLTTMNVGILQHFTSLPTSTLISLAGALNGAVDLVANLVMLCTIVIGVVRSYGYPIERVWWWFVLALGFAPLLNTLHLGQINIVTSFGLLLMFMYEQRHPSIAGFGLALAIATKLSPIVFCGYLVATRALRAVGWSMAWLAAMTLGSILLFGSMPLLTYPSVLMDLVRTPAGIALASLLESRHALTAASGSQFQALLTGYAAIMLLIAGVLTLLTRQREPLFIVTSFLVVATPSLVWYHHVVFVLLPLFVWMAWSRFRPAIVAWSAFGLFLMQLERFHVTGGLLVHAFMQLSVFYLVVSQFGHLRGGVIGVWTFRRGGSSHEATTKGLASGDLRLSKVRAACIGAPAQR